MGIFYAREYGAFGDGKNLDTAAIQTCIDRCAAEGGGKVLLENGVFVSGTLYLKSGVVLEIASDAKLLASPDIADYGKDTHYNRYRNEPELDRCFIYAEDAKDIGLCGLGEINGNAACFPNEGSIYRPMLIRFLRCRNIRMSDLKLYDAAAWTTAFLDSKYIWVNGLDIQNETNYNGDGLDFDGCAHVFVSDCLIKGTDDNLCLQAGSRHYPVQDVHISDCEFTSVCAAIRIGLKSIGDIKDVVIKNCTMHEVWREGIKIECSEGGSISNILITGIAMRNVTRPVFLLLNNRYEPDGLGSSVELEEMPKIGSMERISISEIYEVDETEMEKEHLRFGKDLMGSPRFAGIRIDAEKEHPIRDISLKGIYYSFTGGVCTEEIPAAYPEVLDRKKYPKRETVENYYPDWIIIRTMPY